ncbi:MAG: BBP7 family outer membrane beta-barrel protein, partial [Planctomycetes bacterium]|nr:BBP7 family outer membrane beta-barrel protein [Planctomycetota bacterium]
GSVVLEAPTEAFPPGEFDAYQEPNDRNSACGPRHRIWGGIDYLYWSTKGMKIPALVTTSESGTPQDEAGVLGLPGTSVRFGNRDLFDSHRNGLRWVLGAWFEPQRRMGVEIDSIGLRDESSGFHDSSNGVDILARPFTNVDPALGPDPVPDSELISYTNVIAGGVEVNAWNEFYSFGIHLRGNILFRNGCFYQPGQPCVGSPSGYRLDLLGGYRYLGLKDHLAIQSLTSVSITPQAGFDVLDRFNTNNNFQGGELGVLYQYYRNRWTADGVLKFALGRSEQKVGIAGTTDFSMLGAETEFEGGLLALPTNIGHYSRKDTDLITELGLTVGYLVTSNMRVTCGYRVIYWPQVARAGDQIDLTVNGSYIPDPTVTPSGPLRPAFAFRETSYWAQGLSFGVDYRW